MSYQPCEDGRAMIKKTLRALFRCRQTQSPQNSSLTCPEWQSEVLFLPARPPIRDDTDSLAMTRRAFVPCSRKSHFQGL
jgi:hypothetical protein